VQSPLHTETAFDANDELIAADKSEYRAGTHIRHLWHCPTCSARFESIEQIPVEAMTTDDIFPALLVA
jgi:transcriptional regulator NrdR family protein